MRIGMIQISRPWGLAGTSLSDPGTGDLFVQLCVIDSIVLTYFDNPGSRNHKRDKSTLLPLLMPIGQKH